MAEMNCGMLEGYAYVRDQKASDRNLYDPETALSRGTIFPTLDLPLGVYGNQTVKTGGSCNE